MPRFPYHLSVLHLCFSLSFYLWSHEGSFKTNLCKRKNAKLHSQKGQLCLNIQDKNKVLIYNPTLGVPERDIPSMSSTSSISSSHTVCEKRNGPKWNAQCQIVWLVSYRFGKKKKGSQRIRRSEKYGAMQMHDLFGSKL